MDQIGYQRGQAVILAIRPSVFDRNVLSFNKPRFGQAFAISRDDIVKIVGSSAGEKPDHRHAGPLRQCHQRPACRRAAEPRDERASFHSITSSARARSDGGGTVRPSAFAVFEGKINFDQASFLRLYKIAHSDRRRVSRLLPSVIGGTRFKLGFISHPIASPP